MDDVAHKWTDEQIAALEERVRLAYRSAQIDVQGKLYKFLHRFERDNEKFRQQLKDGKITQATYRDWLRGQIFQRKRWRALLDALTDTLANANELAMEIINDAVPAVMAYNANWATYQIEHAGNIDTGFVLYDQNTVARLLRDEPDLLPPSRVDIPKDKRWNSKLITAQINQGIIQGEPLETIARRLARVVTGMNINQARTHARTAMTGAQNAGRMEGIRWAEDELGIEVAREWIATLDYHTRYAHGLLDGQTKRTGEPFVVTYRYGKHVVTDSIMYPGDPSAPGRMVYNCRCTLGMVPLEYPNEYVMRRPNLQELGDALVQKPIKDMTYAEWIGWKKKAQKALKAGGQRGIMQSEWANAKFRNEKAEKKHEKHLPEYGNISFDAYVQAARELLSAPTSSDVEEFQNNMGYTYKYRKSTNDFAIGGDGHIITMFKPNDGAAYWEGEKAREKV